MNATVERKEVTQDEARSLLRQREQEMKAPPISQAELDAMERARSYSAQRQADDKTDNSTLDGAPGTIKLGGRTYLVGQPGLEDASSVAAFLKTHARKPLNELQDDPAFAYLPADEQKSRLLDAARLQLDQQRQPWTGEAALAAMMTLQGVRFQAWLLIRKHHPEFAFDDACKLITEENYVPVSIELDFVSGMAKLGNSAGPPG